MADDSPQSVDQFASAETSAENEETNWGEDWESAFQAEDDAFFSDEKEEENFFLEENEPTAAPGVAAQELDSSLKKTLSGIPDQDVASGAHPRKALLDLEPLTALFLTGKIAAQKQFTRLQSFPIFVRIPLYASPFLIIGILFALTSTSPPPPALLQPASSPSQHPGTATGPPEQPAHAEAPPGEMSQASQLHPGKVRKKWGFPAFIIPINNPAPDQPVTFVLVDITLVASMNDQEDPPEDKKIFVRDIIYQFFQNKPLEELRRFSLARGEMNKELRAWLLKQWPEAPIESIIFNQYHLS